MPEILKNKKCVWVLFIAIALFGLFFVNSNNVASADALEDAINACNAQSGCEWNDVTGCVCGGGQPQPANSMADYVDKNSPSTGWGLISWITGAATSFIALIANYIMAFIAGVFILFASWLIDFALALNSQVMNIGAVKVGWVIVRDIANLGFVLGIILIAFSTIIRSQTYGIKQTLWRLIVMAVLINFSLTIAGIFLDMAGIMTQYFVDKATPAGSGLSATHDFATSISYAFQPQKAWSADSVAEAAGGFSASTPFGTTVTAVGSIFFTAFFTFLGVISFLGVAIMLFIRFIAIAILLILAPIAWLGWVFPGLGTPGGSWWSKWWGEFIRWTFFAPAATFFLYLALMTVRGVGQLNGAVAISTIAKRPEVATAAAAMKDAGGIQTPSNDLASMIVMIGLMWGALMVANSFGIHTAAAFNKAASWGQAKMIGAVKGAGRRAGQRALLAGQKEKDGEKTSAVQRGVSTLATIPVLGRAFRGLSETVGRAVKIGQDEVEKRQKGLSGITDKDALNRGNSASSVTNPVEAAAIFAEIARRGLTAKIDPDQLDKLVKFAQQTGTLGKILETRPDLASKALAPNQTMADAIAKAMKRVRPGQADKIEETSLKLDPTRPINGTESFHVTMGLTPQHLERIAKEGSVDQKANIRAVVDESINQINTLTAEERDKLDKVSDHIFNNPNLWG